MEIKKVTFRIKKVALPLLLEIKKVTFRIKKVTFVENSDFLVVWEIKKVTFPLLGDQKSDLSDQKGDLSEGKM